MKRREAGTRKRKARARQKKGNEKSSARFLTVRFEELHQYREVDDIPHLLLHRFQNGICFYDIWHVFKSHT